MARVSLIACCIAFLSGCAALLFRDALVPRCQHRVRERSPGAGLRDLHEALARTSLHENTARWAFMSETLGLPDPRDPQHGWKGQAMAISA